MKTCRKCGVEKHIDEFHRNPSCKDGRQTACRACANAQRASRVVSLPVHGVERGQTWLYEGETLTVLGVTPGPGGGYRVVYKSGNRNKTLSLAWLKARGELAASA